MQPYDFAILDLCLPDDSGDAILKHIRVTLTHREFWLLEILVRK